MSFFKSIGNGIRDVVKFRSPKKRTVSLFTFFFLIDPKYCIGRYYMEGKFVDRSLQLKWLNGVRSINEFHNLPNLFIVTLKIYLRIKILKDIDISSKLLSAIKRISTKLFLICETTKHVFISEREFFIWKHFFKLVTGIKNKMLIVVRFIVLCYENLIAL